MRLLSYMLLLAPVFASAVIIDRIAIIIENKVIKDSDIEREIRVASYLNCEKLDLSPQSRKRAAQRLIDQSIIRREIEAGRYSEASDEDVDKLLASTLQSRKAPQAYSLTKDQVRSALKWQMTVLHFIDIRFQGGESSTAKPEGSTPSEAKADPFIAWLDDIRKTMAIQYREEDLR